jgi:3-hydroxybutyryl-CoA dehydrogenase
MMRAAVVGGGTMGTGIAYVSVVAGIPTTVVEPNADRRTALLQEIDGALANGISRGKLTESVAGAARAALSLVPSVEAMPADLDLVIETVSERPEVKELVLREIDAKNPAIIASNTSSMSINVLASFVREPSRFLGLHFFNPVWSIPLVEVVRGALTSQQTLDTALAFVVSIGKQSAVINDAPGFATSRLDLIVAAESIRMVEEGVGSPEDIDRAITLAYRHPVGPLTLTDIVGLDVRLDIMRQLEISLGDRFAPPQLLVDMVERGDLGKKSGQGFYEWQ